ncbi:WD40 repeat-like protein [Atractiella rhizophila]|nr:WD40 repeat-like protein [Atractiella rhizophila]
MRVRALEIRWHDHQPIFSVDFCRIPPGSQYRKQFHPYTKSGQEHGAVQYESIWKMATAGGDKKVRVWLVHPPSTAAQQPEASTSTSKLDRNPANMSFSRVEYLATLAKHTSVVNVVRFSPKAEVLASAGDDGCIIIWVPTDKLQWDTSVALEEKEFEREFWRAKSAIKLHTDGQIYDLAWSPDGQKFITGCTDNTARIYTVDSECIAQITDHSNYVQGVAWDPLGQYIATQSSDRSMHIYSLSLKENGEVHVDTVGKNTKMEVSNANRPANSFSSWISGLPTPTPGHGEFKTPSLRRSVSVASESGRSESSISVLQDHSTQASTSASALNPNTLDLPPPPLPTHSLHNSPTKPNSHAHPHSRSHSRKSSQSGSILTQSPRLSATARGRSPSPMPMPAIKPPPSPAPSTTVFKMYGDEKSTPFFRRLSWSVDGGLLVTPAGVWEDPAAAFQKMRAEEEAHDPSASGTKKRKRKEKEKEGPKPAVYLYARGNIAKPPVAQLTGYKTTSIAVRFNPVLWELRRGVTRGRSRNRDGRQDEEECASVFKLPYRMIYAVVTHEGVYIYDTQQAAPLCMIGNLHCASFTDLSWTPDGQTIICASQDGYCSAIYFDVEELGEHYNGVQMNPIPQYDPSLDRKQPNSSAQPPLPMVLPAVQKRDREEADGQDGEPKKKRRAVLTRVEL